METRRSRRQRDILVEASPRSTEIIRTDEGTYRIRTGRNKPFNPPTDRIIPRNSPDVPSTTSSGSDPAPSAPSEDWSVHNPSGRHASSRRLFLEYTFNQAGENRLSELLGRLDRAIRAADSHLRPTQSVVDIAKGINQIRLNQGNDDDRMTVSFGHSHLHGDQGYVDKSWSRTNPMRFTPTTLAPVAAEIRNGVHQNRLATFWLSLANYCVSVRDLVKMFGSYNGEPCNIMDLATVPPQCVPILTYLRDLYTVKFRLAQEICKASSEEEAAALSARLTELQVEHCCLCNLMVTSNSRLIGPWNKDWNPPRHLSPAIRDIMEGLLLREEQLAKFRALRQSILDKLSHLSVAQSCVSDLMKDILGRDPPPEAPLGVEANLDLLNTVEATSSAQISMAAYEYSCVESTLSRILSPLQSAQLMDKVSLLMATSVDAQSIQYMADRIRFFSFIILDREMSSWMNCQQGAAEFPLCPPGLLTPRFGGSW